MHDAAAIAAALRAVRTDVVVLIRGGGDAAGFAVFEDPRVLEALAACRAYRILGLGHTANRTLAELVADHAASTPTAAGEHLGRQIARAGQMPGLEGRIAELHETLARQDMELAHRQRPARVVAPEPLPPADVPEPVVEKRWTVPGWVWAIMGAAAAWAVLRFI